MSSAKLEETANKAVKRMRDYAENEENFYQNPKEMLDEMNSLKTDMQGVWKEVKDEHDKQHQQEKESSDPMQQHDLEDFRSSYVAAMTDAFDDSLEALRQQSDGDVDISILVEAMQSGIDLLSPEERGFFLEELQGQESSTE